MFEAITQELTMNDQPVRVHALSTGVVIVPKKFKEGKRKGLWAKLDILLDSEFAEWMPVWVWVIEHPEGVFLIDSGAHSKINNDDYFKKSGFFAHWFNRKYFKFQINREQEIDQQLLRLSLSSKNIQAIILTHLHIDHTDGLSHFPDTKVLVSKVEWDQPSGHLPKLYPPWFKPELISYEQKYKCFDQACFLTKNMDLIALHTPGHTHGSMSVLLKTDQCDLLFVGDVCYEQNQIISNHFSGANINFLKAKDSYEKIKQLAKTDKIIVLPSHDGEAGIRLKDLQVL